MLIPPVLAVALLFFSFCHDYIDEGPFGPNFLRALALLSLFLPFGMKFLQTPHFTAHGGFAIIVAAAAVYMLGHGGIVSPQGVWLSIVPGIAYYIVGPVSFFVWLTIVLLIVASVAYISFNNIVLDLPWLPHVIPKYLPHDYLFVTGGILILYSAVTFMMEHERMQAEEDMQEAQQKAEDALEQLLQAQKKLVEQEKMASLGQLVAGVSHEVNSPIGNALTASSLLYEQTKRIEKIFYDGAIRKSDFQEYIERVIETSRIILANIERAASLVQSFKKIAVDQEHDDIRPFNLASYIDDVILSLKPTLHRAGHEIAVNCRQNIDIKSNPGAWSQIITNLVMNSVAHAYEPGRKGKICLSVIENTPRSLTLIYSDDGRGIPQEHISKIFDPFFTTKRGEGGSGLGLNIVFNLVTHTLGGEISVDSEPGMGTTFKIHVPNRDLI